VGQDYNCIKSKITQFLSVKFGFLRKGYKNYDGVNDVYLSNHQIKVQFV
jgi:transcription termination factor Rho